MAVTIVTRPRACIAPSPRALPTPGGACDESRCRLSVSGGVHALQEQAHDAKRLAHARHVCGSSAPYSEGPRGIRIPLAEVDHA
ncbi:hypothetical protein [Luteimonas sp. 3794]|uniref:hypothetical protein n=1 Tax=Luteimonas sp. 3794 TaxID=2817730 RepID=UPI002866E0F7|nr:hypothetical protein [Luteimonas sp. 3794]MDR6990636.1 hypothetical protein [Luteimonas sp. 3794]